MGNIITQGLGDETIITQGLGGDEQPAPDVPGATIKFDATPRKARFVAEVRDPEN